MLCEACCTAPLLLILCLRLCHFLVSPSPPLPLPSSVIVGARLPFFRFASLLPSRKFIGTGEGTRNKWFSGKVAVQMGGMPCQGLVKVVSDWVCAATQPACCLEYFEYFVVFAQHLHDTTTQYAVAPFLSGRVVQTKSPATPQCIVSSVGQMRPNYPDAAVGSIIRKRCNG